MFKLLVQKIKKIEVINYYPFLFTLVFILFLFQYPFTDFEAVFYDLRVKYDIGHTFEDNFVIITMDEESDEFLGEAYPYTYTTHRRMLERLVQDSPSIINYFVGLFPPENDSERLGLNNFRDKIGEYVDKGGKFRFALEGAGWGELGLPKDLEKFGSSLGIINTDSIAFSKDEVSRRAILNISGEDSIHLWTANMYREKRGLPPLVAGQINGAYYFAEADATFAAFRYFTNPAENIGPIKKIPFHRVLVGNFPKGYFTDKIVLLGPSYLWRSDYVLTPFNKELLEGPKMMVHAEIIQALIHNKTIKIIPKSVSNILCVLMSIFLSIIISRIRPTKGLSITIVVMIGVLLFSYFLFVFGGYWLYISHLVLTVFVVYYIWVPFRAIGEYQQRYAIEEESKLLKKVEDLKQNFISLMSHDLKTPVAKIAGIVDILKRQCPREATIQKNLNLITDSTKELNRFLSSILDLTKIESQNLNLNRKSKDVTKTIVEVLKGLSYEAEQKNIKLENDLAVLYPIQYDEALLKRVISNLVENAIKYSGESSTVKVKTWDDNDWVYVEISDNGVGINKNDINYIFEKFYRVKNDASHSIKGTGLGLYLVKYFVELHGGTIQVDSEKGQGTRFLILLPNS
jgi:signal transduction histidine kinase